MKFIIINNFQLAAKRSAGLSKQEFEKLTCEHLASVVEHAVKSEARIIFTSDWLSNVSDATAYRLVSLLAKTSGVYAIGDAMNIDPEAMEALDITGIKSSVSAGKVTLTATDDGLTFSRDSGEGLSLVTRLLPSAFGRSDNTVLLVEVSKRGRSAVKIALSELALTSYEEQLAPATSKRSSLSQQDSTFVKKLKKHLSVARTNESLDGVLEQRVLHKMAERELGESSRQYIGSLLNQVNDQQVEVS